MNRIIKKLTKEQILKEKLAVVSLSLAKCSEEYKELSDKYNELGKYVDETKSKIQEIIDPDRNRFGTYRNAAIKLSDLPTIIAQLKGKVEGSEGKDRELKPYIDQTREETLNKLWYLVRVAMKDDTIKETKAPFMSPGGFNSKDFKNENL